MIRPALALLSGLVLCGCGGDGESTPATPPPPPTLEISAVRAVGGGTWMNGDPGDLELGCDVDQRVVVAVTTTDWTFRPPETCGSTENCGYVLLRVDADTEQEMQAAAAAPNVLFAMSALASPTGPHHFSVQLYGATSHKPAVNGSEVVSSEVALTVGAPASCP